MKLSRRLLVLIQLIAAVGTVFNPQFAFAYEHPLSTESVREAYFVGQDGVNVNKFLSQYLQSLPMPDKGPDVAEIEISTPYAQVVEASALHSVDYTASQAQEDYEKRGDYIAVRVKVLFTRTYTTANADYWRDVSVELVQKTKRMVATSVTGQPIYLGNASGSEAPYPSNSIFIGADIYLKFSVEGVQSDSLEVEVVPPGGPAVSAPFDLSSLQ